MSDLERVLEQQTEMNNLLIARIKALDTVVLDQINTINKIIEVSNKNVENIDAIADQLKSIIQIGVN